MYELLTDNPLLTAITIWLCAINLIAFMLMGVDKAHARSNKRRIPEKTLFIIALMGGSVGILAGMRSFRHKTRKISFQFSFILIIAVQAAIILGAMRYTGQL